jgi:3-phosphoshikimate 1-carboxyvinyltransferase
VRVSGTIYVPGDKSISHRALILSSLAEGESRIRGILDSADVRATAGVLRALGVTVPSLSADMAVRGRGIRGLRQPPDSLDCGNSGTTTRLMAGVVAGHRISATFEGDASLSRRPMRRIAEPLTSMGARFEFANGDGLPMTISGADLRAADWNTGGSSAQVKSAILLAALVAGVEARVTETSLSRDHTERMLRAMGVEVKSDGTEVRLRPASKLDPIDATVPGDPSSAAFFVALGCLADNGSLDLPNVCMNPTRSGFFAVMRRMGADIGAHVSTVSGGEETATLTIRPSRLIDGKVIAGEVPSLIDELPLLACVAAGAGVNLEISGASELRVKESDRISVVVSNLKAVGAHAEERPDGLRILAGRKKLRGSVDPHGDHRIAMAFGVLGKCDGNDIVITDRDCVAVSYPGFWKDLDGVAA